jgi:hypothetical protein
MLYLLAALHFESARCSQARTGALDEGEWSKLSPDIQARYERWRKWDVEVRVSAL